MYRTFFPKLRITLKKLPLLRTLLLWPAIVCSLQACALRPTLKDWGLLDDAESDIRDASIRRARPMTIDSHHFSLSPEQTVLGELAVVELQDGDTLADLARHFGVGFEEVRAANPGVDPWLAGNGQRALIPARYVLPRVERRGIVVNLAAMRLFLFVPREDRVELTSYPVGIGKEGRSTPTGAMWIARKKEHPVWHPTDAIRADHRRRGHLLPGAVPPGPDNPLGDYAIYLSRQPYLIHGTNKPYSIGWRASNGCIRLYPENIEELFPDVPPRETVRIVNQPFLVGRDGRDIYLQAYRPQDELNESLLRRRVLDELRKLERAESLRLDWGRIGRILDETRGIPLPITSGSLDIERSIASARTVDRPPYWLGQPTPPKPLGDGWKVRVADVGSEISARRLLAVLAHQSPPIPAALEQRGETYDVHAGPFASAAEAKAAERQIRFDLDLPGRIEPPAVPARVSDRNAPDLLARR